MKQKDKVISYLKTHKKISQREALQLGVYRLASRICDIKRDGVRITSERVRVKNTDGSTSIIAVYRLGGKV